jgi:phosphoribosylglycinamide formyltransferase-1
VREQLVSEPIHSLDPLIDTAALSRGEPSLPRRFRWREREYAVASVIGKWKTTSLCRSGSSEKYVRKHWWKVRTETGEVMKLYFNRQPKSPGEMKWFLYSLEVPAP